MLMLALPIFPSRSARRAALCALVPALCALGSGSLAAQEITSREVVQPLPTSEVQRLNRALMQLARDPRDLAALLEAGEASLAVDDFDAASGFFARALAVVPDDRRALVGLARVALSTGDGPQALDRFAQAEAAGMAADAIVAERALAFDLVGDQASAQSAYARALALDPRDAESRRRLALSYAISGNRANFEDALRPLLDARDGAALRTRAFGLAIFGDQERAAAIVEQAMPRDLSSRLIPYLSFMPRLTKAQQAGAANLGIFPRAADIGRDDPRLARFAAEAQADSRLQPSGAPLGSGATPAASARGGASTSPSRPGVVPSAARSARRERAPRAVPTPAPSPRATPAPAPASSLTTKTPAIAAQTTAILPAPGASQTPAPAPVVAAVPAALAPPPALSPPISAPVPAPLRVADAFADLSGGLPAASVGAGAVDISAIAIPREVAAKPEPKPEAKPKEPLKPVHPSRIWVQIATGRDVSALKFDWRRFERQSSDVLKGMSPHITRWGVANRLLVGPLDSQEKARDLLKKLKDKGIDGFSYVSPEGEVIQTLN
jgi:tetratricopeptide (TPR) repeat protein